MTIIKPNSKPRLWWLFPWSYARTLHTSANALRALSDRLDDALTLQSHVIADQSEEIANLRQQLEDKSQDIHTLQARVRAQDQVIQGLISK